MHLRRQRLHLEGGGTYILWAAPSLEGRHPRMGGGGIYLHVRERHLHFKGWHLHLGVWVWHLHLRGLHYN